MRTVYYILLILCLIVFVYSREIVSEEGKHYAAGTVFNTEGAGLEADFFFIPAWV